VDHGGLHWPRASQRSENGLEPERLHLYARCRARPLCDQEAICRACRLHALTSSRRSYHHVCPANCHRWPRLAKFTALHTTARPRVRTTTAPFTPPIRTSRRATATGRRSPPKFAADAVVHALALSIFDAATPRCGTAPRRSAARALLFFRSHFSEGQRFSQAPLPLCSCARWCRLRVCVVCACVSV
jgi:hypothetical protein